MFNQQSPNITMMPVLSGQLQAVYWYCEEDEGGFRNVITKVPVVALAMYAHLDREGNVGYQVAGLVHDPETGQILLTTGDGMGFSNLCDCDQFLGFESAEVTPDWEARVEEVLEGIRRREARQARKMAIAKSSGIQ
jgi:hypothetical protein